jgi:hypothetical protein
MDKPTLSTENQLRVVIAHRNFLKANAALEEAKKSFQENYAALAKTVNDIGLEMGLEKDKWTINIDTLEIAEKQ